jgi:hypothetical protein
MTFLIAVGASLSFRWCVVVMAAPYGCTLDLNGLGDLADASFADGAPGSSNTVEGGGSGVVISGSSSGAGSSGSPIADGGGPTDGSDSGGGSTVATCPAQLQDQVTACTPPSPDCSNACGPEVPEGGSLGLATCSCNASSSVYQCSNCVYPTPLPPCYAIAGSPPTCPPNAASGSACPKPCDSANANATPACAFVMNNGKVNGCQCILKAGAKQPVWTCAARW